MQVSGIRVEDIVQCDVRGQKFYALVEKAVHREGGITNRRVLKVQPICRNVTVFTVTPTQIVNHWRKKRARKGTTK